MAKRILIRAVIEFISLLLILCGIDLLFGDEVVLVTNIIISLVAVLLKTMLSLKKYYAYRMQEQEEEMNNKLSE